MSDNYLADLIRNAQKTGPRRSPENQPLDPVFDSSLRARAKRAALSTAQGASNAAAGTVSAPVDLLNWGLGKVGLGSEEPVGGSDWMRRQGLTAEPESRSWGLAGETLGNVLPIVAQAKQAQIAKGLLQGGENLAKPQMLDPQTGAILWHGTPHEFTRFDPTKLGTGAGQAFGRGHYLAEEAKEADMYAKALGHGRYTIKGKPLDRMNPVHKEALAVHEMGGDVDRLRDHLYQQIQGNLKAAQQFPNMAEGFRSDIYALEQRMRWLDRNRQNIPRVEEAPSKLKAFDFPDAEIARMASYEAPLGYQPPAVKEAFKELGLKDRLDPYKHPVGDFIRRANLEKTLPEVGVPGLHYAAVPGVSTDRNFVVFPGQESKLTFLHQQERPWNYTAGKEPPIDTQSAIEILRKMKGGG
jgi:hypothetical protein